MPQTGSQIWYWLFLPVKQWREQNSSQNHFWHNDSVCPDVWANSEVHCLPTSRVNRKTWAKLRVTVCVIKGTLISAILKTNMVTPIFFAFSDRKWIKKCLYQIWAKSYRFWKFIETAANLLKGIGPSLIVPCCYRKSIDHSIEPHKPSQDSYQVWELSVFWLWSYGQFCRPW